MFWQSTATKRWLDPKSIDEASWIEKNREKITKIKKLKRFRQQQWEDGAEMFLNEDMHLIFQMIQNITKQSHFSITFVDENTYPEYP